MPSGTASVPPNGESALGSAQVRAVSAMIELWLVDVDRAAPALEACEQAEPRLSSDDRARARRLNDPTERRRRLAAYIALRIAIERIAGPHVRGIAFVRSPGGKPRLADDEAVFSLAHSEGMALLGVARHGDIGIDLEHKRPVRVAQFRRPRIVAAGLGLGGATLRSDGDEAFLQAWSRLEAFAKATGCGVARLLAEVGVRGDTGCAPASAVRVEAAARRLAKEGGLAVHDLELRRDLYAAVAMEEATAVPPVRSFPHETSGIERLLSSRAASGRRR